VLTCDSSMPSSRAIDWSPPVPPIMSRIPISSPSPQGK
jgi:hypothetical protein